MKNSYKLVIFAFTLFFGNLMNEVSAGPMTYAACQTGCNVVATACYSAGGGIFGTITFGLGVPAVFVSCSIAQGTCMAGCAALIVAPTP